MAAKGTRKQSKPRGAGRKRAPRKVGVIGVAQRARAAAAAALNALGTEIKKAEAHLEALHEAQRDLSFAIGERVSQMEERLSPSFKVPAKRGRPRKTVARPKGPTKADAFFARLANNFSLEDVRALAGKLSGVSLAQWSRAKKIRKLAGGRYRKIAGAK